MTLCFPEPGKSAEKIIASMEKFTAKGVEVLAFSEVCLCGYACDPAYWQEAVPFTGPYGGPWQGHWTSRSTDHGHSWQDPVPSHVTAPHGPIQLCDGRLLFLGQRPHCSHGEPADWNGSPAQSPYAISIAESRDDGRSWQVISDFPVPADAQMLSYDEPHMVERADGLVVALFRDCNGDHPMHQAISADGG